jgi:hypothetical protein
MQLSCSPDSSTEDKLRELKRLEALTAWLQQQGHAVTSFSIQTSSNGGDKPDGYVSGRSFGVSNILEALAAAGSLPGGMRLRQLQVPAVGLATPTSLARALSGCHQLRDLQLDPDCGIGTIGGAGGYLDRGLCMALQHLTQLTALKLYAGDDDSTEPDLDGLLTSLPRSLEVLDMDFDCMCTGSLSSLQHLVALKELTLPAGCFGIWRSSSSSNPLHTLTSVTYLASFGALVFGERLMSALPNLVELWGAITMGSDLEWLPSKASLRSLVCSPFLGRAGVETLAQLTQLTQLRLCLDSPMPVGAAQQSTLVAWGAALSSLTGLRSLALQPQLLEKLDIAAFTALTRLEVFLKQDPNEECSFPNLGPLLGGLAPACGRLQQVLLLGVPGAQQELCRTAVAAALGEVSLVFCEQCDRREWCVCCHRV